MTIYFIHAVMHTRIESNLEWFVQISSSGRCFFIWAGRFLDVLKLVPQSEQKYGFSPVWTLRCCFRCPDWEKLFPQCEHVCGFSPVWILWCLFNVSDEWKAFPHSKHMWGLAPLCVFWCFFKQSSWEKLFPQREHECGFESAWISMCLFRCEGRMNAFPHWWQWNARTPEWERWCFLRPSANVKLFPHWGQEKGFSPLWIRSCLTKSPLRLKLFPHWGQRKHALVLWEKRLSGCERLEDISPVMKWWGETCSSMTSNRSEITSWNILNSYTKGKWDLKHCPDRFWKMTLLHWNHTKLFYMHVCKHKSSQYLSIYLGLSIYLPKLNIRHYYYYAYSLCSSLTSYYWIFHSTYDILYLLKCIKVCGLNVLQQSSVRNQDTNLCVAQDHF